MPCLHAWTILTLMSRQTERASRSVERNLPSGPMTRETSKERGVFDIRSLEVLDKQYSGLGFIYHSLLLVYVQSPGMQAT